MPRPTFADALAHRPLILDGGFGTLLEARGHDLSSSLWSARLLRDDPDAVRAAHAEFVAAGADVVITSSYQVGYDNLAAAGLDEGEVDEMLRASVRLAREAADAADHPVFVAASIGPYGAARADGSEYTGAYDVRVGGLRTWHRRRLQVLADAGADVLAVETIPSLDEVEAVAAELDGLSVPVWVSLSAGSAALTSADRAEAFRIAADVPEVVAVGVNCCPPGDVSAALAVAPAGVPLVAYPNRGERWNASTRTWEGGTGEAIGDPRSWVESGVLLIGGCCRTTPADIAALVSTLRAA